MHIDLKLFHKGVFVIIQAIIFLYVWRGRVKLKMLINARFLLKPCGCKVSTWKIQKSSLAFWSFGSQWPINCTLISSCVPLWLHRKKCSINFSCLNPCLSSPSSLILDLYWLNLSRNRPYVLFKTYLAC